MGVFGDHQAAAVHRFDVFIAATDSRALRGEEEKSEADGKHLHKAADEEEASGSHYENANCGSAAFSDHGVSPGHHGTVLGAATRELLSLLLSKAR